MPDIAPSSAYEVTQDDRSMALLAHFLQIVCWWMAPLVIFLLRRESPFVRFHALQALLLQICLVIFWISGFAVFMVAMFITMPTSGTPAHHEPPAVMIVFPIFWLLAMSSWATVLIIAVLYGIKAGRGEWAAYPVIGRMARRLLNT